MNNQENKIKTGDTNVLVSTQTRNLFVLIVAVIVIMIISGILGAFKSGKFMKTYDFVEVNIPYDEVNYNDPIFKDLTDRSKEVIKYEKEYMFNEETQENIEIKVKMYKGYNTKYFFQSSWFYGDAALNTLIVLIFYITLVGYLLAKRMMNDQLYIKLEGELNQLVIEENQLPAVTFEPFIYDWNMIRKKKQHISNIKYKLAKLEQKTPYKIRKEFYVKNEEGKVVFQIPNRELTYKEFKYLETKENLESYITDEYINEHVEFEKVKYFKYIHPSFVTTGKNEIIQSTDEYSAIQTNKEKQSKDYAKKALLGLAISFAIASLLSYTLFKIDEGWLVVVWNVFMRMLPLVLQVVLAIDYVNRLMGTQKIPVLRYRLNIANLYLANKSNKEVKE